MASLDNLRTALTFDDVLLVPRRSSVASRADISVATQLTRNVRVSVPIVSSNMDTVTEAPMAIAMARAGGIGILHRFLSVDDQVAMVERVKRAQSVVIAAPYTIAPTASLAALAATRAAKGVGSILVTDPTDNTLLGIVTTRDLALRSDTTDTTTVRSVMTPRARLVTGTRDTTVDEARALMRRHRLEKLPLVDSDGTLCGLITARDITAQETQRGASLDAHGQLMVGAAVGVKPGFETRAARLVAAGANVLVVDIAHGHSDLCIHAVRTLKAAHPHTDVIAGNVCTAAGTRDLIEAGADAVKVGVGPGSICVTRMVTGAGYPQLSAIAACAAAAHTHGVPIIADGGIRSSGDITKALAAGAATVMLGSMLAGTDESPGRTLTKDHRKVKVVRGMAGYGATLSKRERERDDDPFDIVPEGVEGLVPYRGAVTDVLRQLVGGLRSGVSYCGCSDLAAMQRTAAFVRVTGAGRGESRHHDVHKL